MLPLLAESLSAVLINSSIQFIAFPADKHHRTTSSWYVTKLADAQRRKIKAPVEINGIGRGPTTADDKREDRSLASGWAL